MSLVIILYNVCGTKAKDTAVVPAVQVPPTVAPAPAKPVRPMSPAEQVARQVAAEACGRAAGSQSVDSDIRVIAGRAADIKMATEGAGKLLEKLGPDGLVIVETRPGTAANQAARLTPEELKKKRQWVMYRIEFHRDKIRKKELSVADQEDILRWTKNKNPGLLRNIQDTIDTLKKDVEKEREWLAKDQQELVELNRR